VSPAGQRWLRIARNEVGEVRRDRTLLALVALFTLLGVLLGYLLAQGVGFAEPGTTYAVLVLQLLGILVPLVAVGITYERLVGRRVDGSLKLLLGLPYLRWDVLLGSYVGRAVVTIAVTVVAFISILLSSVVFGAGVPTGPLPVQAFLLIVALGVVFTGIGITASSVTSTTSRAAMLTFLVTVVMLFLWGPAVTGLVWIVNGFQFAAAEPAWATFLQTLNPVNAFKGLASMLVPTFEGVAGLVGGETAYQTPAWAVGVLATWAVVVPLLGYRRFRSADL